MRDVHDALVRAHQHTDYRSAHALQVVVTQRALVDLLVGELDRGRETVLGQREIGIDRERPGRVLFFGGFEKRTHRVGRHHARDLAALMTALAVGDQVQPKPVKTAEGFFVVIAL
jgi:hypothetical protein